MVSFLYELPALKERKHIHRLFKLSCICITDKSPSYPAVSFGGISRASLSCRSIDVFVPVQSFLSNLPNSVPVCTSDKALEEVSTLWIDFSGTGLDSSYDPWHCVDLLFGRAKIHKKLSSSYEQFFKARESPQPSRVRPIGRTSSEMSPPSGIPTGPDWAGFWKFE